MALSVVDVLSWPWAKAYTTFSVCLLTRCIYNLYEEAKDPLIQTALVNKLSQNSPDGRIGDDNVNNEELHSTVLWYQATDSFCIWTERELAMWCVWCSALLFLQLLAQLCKDRFEYLSSSSTTTLASHMRVLSVLMCLFVSSGGLTVICGLLGFFSHDMHTLSFMAVECLMVTIYMSHAILRYTIHLYDLICEDSWEDKEVCIYYTDFVMEMGILFLDMMHHIHMLLYGNIWFSVADLIILTHLRFLSQEMQHRLLQHKNYLHIYDVMDMRFSMATMEELASHDDRCAICWEKMYTAYKLPCGHLFHKSCLRAWLEQDMSCPTCRMSVNMSGSQTRNEQEGASLSVSLGPAAVGNPNRAPISYQSHLFYFDGSQIANWLPGLSVEFVHSPNMIILLQADDSQVHQEE
ncbi:E3 ubiquitin-protein ligase AMFR isoform X2 [Megalobrama amblycephala]|uniref:E3 ubiquitin-protein ligase AMFR isoform X2 n=1 Tax=Megalobrama amblycephala TaxID=75352 RepID=UPI00201461D7|nr:E3 ubiquitin-protein ligase AMFR isoform X2 [Megalobrama amblycephala]